jgi:hypothetical protein
MTREEVNEQLRGKTIESVEIGAANFWILNFTDGTHANVMSDTIWTPAGNLTEIELIPDSDL